MRKPSPGVRHQVPDPSEVGLLISQPAIDVDLQKQRLALVVPLDGGNLGEKLLVDVLGEAIFSSWLALSRPSPTARRHPVVHCVRVEAPIFHNLVGDHFGIVGPSRQSSVAAGRLTDGELENMRQLVSDKFLNVDGWHGVHERGVKVEAMAIASTCGCVLWLSNCTVRELPIVSESNYRGPKSLNCPYRLTHSPMSHVHTSDPERDSAPCVSKEQSEPFVVASSQPR